MTDQQHPITPPPKLVQQWLTEGCHQDYCSATEHAIAQAARWGADQELEACLNEIYKGVGLRLIPYGSHRELLCSDLRAARRPKPPSLKEQALAALNEAVYMADDIPPEGISTDQADTIRRALESLPD